MFEQHNCTPFSINGKLQTILNIAFIHFHIQITPPTSLLNHVNEQVTNYLFFNGEEVKIDVPKVSRFLTASSYAKIN